MESTKDDKGAKNTKTNGYLYSTNAKTNKDTATNTKSYSATNQDSTTNGHLFATNTSTNCWRRMGCRNTATNGTMHGCTM